MKFPGGNQLLFCEQVGTVTSFFEQWNDCERTVVLYALLKRVPFANLKFLQLSIDYNLAQNYSSQSKLQLLETHANNANFLNKLVQRYQTTNTSTGSSTTSSSACCVGGGGAGETNASLHNHNHNNNNTSIANNNLTISDSSCDSEKKSSTFDLSSTSSSSCSSTSGVSCLSSSSSSQTTSSSSSSSALTPGKTQDHLHHQSSKVPSNNNNNSNKTKPVESKKDILNDMLTYLPLLKPGNDDVKSVYMSLIPAAVEDACQQTVPTELVQHILSYLLIHPAVNNDDRRSLSYWLRHLEEHIATSYIPTTLPSATATSTNNNSKNPTKMVNSNSTYFIHPPASQQQQLVGGSNQNLTCKTSSQQSLQFLATAGPWQQMQPTQPTQLHHQHNHHSHHNNNNNGCSTISGSCNHLPQQSSVCISNSSLLSKSQQSLNQAGSSSSSSSSCLDSTSSQLLKTTNLLASLDWCSDVVKKQEDGGGGSGSTIIGDGSGNLGSGVRGIGSVENVSIKDFVPVTFNYSTPQGNNKSIGNSSVASSAGNTSNTASKHHHLIASSSQASGVLLGNSANGSSLNLNSGSSIVSHNLVLSSDLDSSDDNHLSFSKNGTEIFDYDCDYDNEEEFKYLARAAAAVAAGGPSSNGANASSGGTNAAGSAAVPSSVGSASSGPANTSSGSSNSSSSKNRVSFDSNINDYLRVPPIGLGEFDLDGGGLLKTRRSNSLTTAVSSACGLSVGELHQHKQNNECLSAENLSNLQLLQNKPRSFSLTMDSPRSSLTSSGSETRLDDFKQHQMMKIYGSPNVGMSSIAHWLKSLRLHKYVWLFSNLTYEQMMDMTEEYLANLGVTKGARHKLVLCIHKLRERYSVLLRLEKDILSAGGSRTQLGPVFDELTNIVLTPMKPSGLDQQEDIAGMFVKLLDLIATIALTRPICGPQEEESMNVFIWVLERALHNDAFAAHATQIKEYKYKANKLKMAYAPKGHYAKNNSLPANLNKPRWSTTIKHKPNSSADSIKTPHRKSSLQYFTPPMQQSQSSQQQSQQPQQQSQQQNSSSSHTHLQAIPHQYYSHGGHNPNAGTGHNNSYNKSSSYPNFASNLSSGSSSGSNNTTIKTHHVQHLQQSQSQHPLSQQSQQQQQPHHAQQSQQSHVAPHGNFMYHRHSLNNISAHQHQQQFLQQLQNQHQQQQQQQQQQLSVLPSIFLTAIGGGPPPNKGKSQPSETTCLNPKSTTVAPPKSSPVDLLGSKSQNNSIGDINSRLEFLCLQMTEQAIN
ncbi:protein Smaug-like isoform X1 [Aedes albopictus]|uniref:Protein Smaug n=1 Tax=Aedes albopictus TaxID=7160 RepID=A0ABM1YU73_AEDAL